MGSDRSNTRLLATIFLICVVCGSSFNQIGLSGRCSSVIVLNMVQLNEPLSTYSLSSLPFTMGGKAITIPSAGRPTEGMSTSPRLRIFRDIESQTNSLHIPTSAYELPVLPDEEPMVLHTKRLQFAYSMLSRMVVGEVHKNTGSNKLIKAHVDRETGEMAKVGVLCEMVESRRFQTGEIAYVLQGLRTVNLLAFKQRRPFLTAMVSEIHPPSTSTLLPEQQFDYSRGETLSTTTTSSTAAPAMSYLDILASEELCEDIYKDLCTVLRLYKLLSRRPVDPTPQSTGFELFAPDGMPEPSGATMTEHTLGTGTGTVEANHADQAKELSSEELQTSPPPPPPSPTPTQPSAKARSTVAELLAARTGVPGVELPAEIFQNRPMAALEYTHDVLAEMVGHGEELLAHLNALPIPGEGKVSSVDVSAAHSSVSVVSAPRKYSTREGGTSLLRKRFKRLRTLASTALRTTVNIFRLPGRKLNMICRAVLQRLLDELPLQQSSSDESEVTTTETSAARPSSSSHQELTLPTDPHISALVHRMRAEVRATQEGMRLRLRSMATEVKDLSALLQFVEDRVKSPSEGVEFSSSAHESSATTVMADNGETVDLTPLLRRHEIFSHAMCLPTASRDPKQLQQCIEMDTLTRLRTVASALNADKEHLIQHALAESLLTRRDVHELEEVDLGNDLDVRCFHDVNITNAVFMGLEDIQAQDTITSVASTAVSHELIQDDLAVSLNKRSVVNATTADAPADRDEALSVRDPRRATPSSCIAVNTKNVESEDSGKQIVNARTIVHDSFFAVDGMFLQ